MDQKQVQEALGRIDQVVSGVNMPRNAHIQLSQDLQLVQQCCVQGLEAIKELEYIKKDPEENKNVGTNQPINNVDACHEDS